MRRSLALILALSACAGSGSKGTTGSSGSGGQCPAEVPVNHRPAEVGCDAGLVPDGGPQCETDSDCPYSNPDAGTPGAGVCSCSPNTRTLGRSAPTNVCVAANCRVDSDCACGSCSPTVDLDCGSFYGTQGYFCHTPQDACVNDSDCDAGYCAHSRQVGHWVCGHGSCAG